jgi:hypothetical protein
VVVWGRGKVVLLRVTGGGIIALGARIKANEHAPGAADLEQVAPGGWQEVARLCLDFIRRFA